MKNQNGTYTERRKASTARGPGQLVRQEAGAVGWPAHAARHGGAESLYRPLTPSAARIFRKASMEPEYLGRRRGLALQLHLDGIERVAHQ